MNEIDKDALRVILFIVILSLTIGLLLGVGVSMLKEKKCINNPLYYGISQFETEDLKIYCSCYFNNPSYASFTFNKTGVFPYGY